MVRDGQSDEVVAQYLQSVTGTRSRRAWPDLESAPGGKYARLREVRVVDEDGEVLESVDIRRPVGIEMTFTALRDDVPMFPKIKLYDREGDAAFNALDTSSEWEEPPAPATTRRRRGFHRTSSTRAYYRVDVAVCSLGRGTSKLIHQTAVREAVSFNVFDLGEGDSSKGKFPGHLRGPVRPLLDWTTERR